MKILKHKKIAYALGYTIRSIAEKKAKANCIGFMYEPKKPKKLTRM